jgi:predicted RNA polymerase sigma factor
MADAISRTGHYANHRTGHTLVSERVDMFVRARHGRVPNPLLLECMIAHEHATQFDTPWYRVNMSYQVFLSYRHTNASTKIMVNNLAAANNNKRQETITNETNTCWGCQCVLLPIVR